MHKRPNARLLALVGALTLSVAALAQTAGSDANARIQEAMKNAASLKSLGFTETFKGSVAAKGQTRESSLTVQVLFRGDKDLACHFSTGREEIRVVSDGSTHYLYVIGGKTYEKSQDPISRSQLMAVAAGGVFRPAANWLADFVNNGSQLLTAAEKVESKGEKAIDGTQCDGYLLAYPAFDVTAWIGKGNTPVLRRAEIDLTKSMEDQTHDGGPVTATVQVDVSDWKPDVEVKDSQFEFIPPDGVEQAKEEPEEKAPDMEGKPAPDFDLPLLGGGKAKLSDLKGKVVVLDFWASWCGPCRMAMPIIDKVTESMADKGVVLYAVNQREEEEAIRGFLDKVKLNPKVALDKEGTAGDAYGAHSIPTIVLIGRDGVVGKYYQGIGPDFENDLKQALEKLAKEPAPAK